MIPDTNTRSNEKCPGKRNQKDHHLLCQNIDAAEKREGIINLVSIIF